MHYEYYYHAENEEGLLAVLTCLGVGLFVGGAMELIAYIFRSLGIYCIARRRGLKRPWMAWVPVLDRYLLGCVSDQYQYLVKRKDTNRRRWLLGLEIVRLVMSAVTLGMGISLIAQVAELAMQGARANFWMNLLEASVLRLVIPACVAVVIAVGAAVLRYMALYDLYASVDPRNRVMYLVVSILCTVTEPFFIFFNRSREDGMPPRKAPPVEEKPEEPWKAEENYG